MSVKNIGAVQKASEKIMKIERKYKARNVQITFLLVAAINRNLSQAIGEKSKHFTVKVQPMGSYMKVILKPKDAVGSYIYWGTKRHSISSSEPMPIGNSRFARNVNHPGTDPMKDKIDAAVRRSLAEVKMIMKVMR
jgi:hypothetical protein